MTKSLLKMGEDFDETTLVVQIRIGKFEVRDVLLHIGFSMNIVYESLRKKLGLKKPKLAPFVVKMVK